jgi:hypothetical protein
MFFIESGQNRKAPRESNRSSRNSQKEASAAARDRDYQPARNNPSPVQPQISGYSPYLIPNHRAAKPTRW